MLDSLYAGSAAHAEKSLSESEKAISSDRLTLPDPQRTGGKAPRPLLSSACDTLDLPHVDTPPSPSSRLSSQLYCGKGSVVGSSPDRSHIVVIPMFCKSWDCPRCGPKKRREWIVKFKNAKPEREITLTCPADKWPDPKDAAWHMKKAFTSLVARIRRTFGPFEYALVWELTKKNTPHMHILSRGTYIPQRWIRAQWIELGIGSIVHISSVTDSEKHAAHICKYLAKDTGQTAASLAPMRIIQVSKKFLLAPPEEKQADTYPDFVWTFDPRHPLDVIEPFLQSPRYQDCQHNQDGTVDIFLDPDPPPDDIYDMPELWVSHPSTIGDDRAWRLLEKFSLDGVTPQGPALPATPDAKRKAVERDRLSVDQPSLWGFLPQELANRINQLG